MWLDIETEGSGFQGFGLRCPGLRVGFRVVTANIPGSRKGTFMVPQGPE